MICKIYEWKFKFVGVGICGSKISPATLHMSITQTRHTVDDFDVHI